MTRLRPTSANNAERLLREELIKSGEDVKTSIPITEGIGYYLIRTEKRYILMKYTREPYHKAEGGRSESINRAALRRIIDYDINGFKTSVIIVYGDTGDFWETAPRSFSLYGTLKTDQDVERFILPWCAKDEDGIGLWERW